MAVIQECHLASLELKPHEIQIVKAFTNPTSETCGVQSLSYLKVKDIDKRSAPQTAAKFFLRNKIKKAVELYSAYYNQQQDIKETNARDRELSFLIQSRESLISRDPVTNKISSSDWPSVLNCTEKICKIENILNDTLKIDVGFQGLLGQLADGERPLLTDAVQDRLKRLGKPSQKHTETDVIDAQFVAQDNAEGVQDQQQADNPPEFPDYA